ncbi:MAG: hypothetical protein ACXVCP_03730 [Bdellovibrio sp.]
MSKKKKKSSAAENLIASLMDDLKDIHNESSYKSIPDEDMPSLPIFDNDENRLEKTTIGSSLWSDLENSHTKGVEEHPSFKSHSKKDLPLNEQIKLEGEELNPEEEKLNSEIDIPVGFETLPPSENLGMMPTAEENHYDGPSSDAGYQSSEDLEASLPPPPPFSLLSDDDDATRPMGSHAIGEDKTVSLQEELNNVTSALTSEADKTIAVEGFANARLGARKSQDVDVKVSIGNHRGSRGSANVLTSVDASLAQAENLKLAQQRILELEREVEALRAENEELASAGEIIQIRTDELGVRISVLEKEKTEIQESAQSEILILKGNLQYKESEVAKTRIKVEELEMRLKSDFKKIRVRERELENRLELLRAEKSALIRSKDDYILEQKRKIDQLSQELDNYRRKCLELNKTIEANQDQVKRTERALRLALTNLEAKEDNNIPMKKAE